MHPGAFCTQAFPLRKHFCSGGPDPGCIYFLLGAFLFFLFLFGCIFLFSGCIRVRSRGGCTGVRRGRRESVRRALQPLLGWRWFLRLEVVSSTSRAAVVMADGPSAGARRSKEAPWAAYGRRQRQRGECVRGVCSHHHGLRRERGRGAEPRGQWLLLGLGHAGRLWGWDHAHVQGHAHPVLSCTSAGERCRPAGGVSGERQLLAADSQAKCTRSKKYIGEHRAPGDEQGPW